jgi:uncharacterized protein
MADKEAQLIEAAKSGDTARVRALLDGPSPPPVESTDNQGFTPLMCAAGSGSGLEMVTMLIDRYHADVNAQANMWQTALIRACTEGHREIVELLLAKGARISARTRWGSFPLIHAAQAGALGVVEVRTPCL